MSLRTFDDKIDDATHAAFQAAGLSVGSNPELAVEVNEALRSLFTDHITDGDEEG